jgi:hypothetical protein
MTAPLTEAQARRNIEERIKQWLVSDTARPGFQRIEMADALDAYRNAIAARVGGGDSAKVAHLVDVQDSVIAALESRAEQAESALAEAKREAFRRGGEWATMKYLHTGPRDLYRDLDAECDVRYPAPTPASVTPRTGTWHDAGYRREVLADDTGKVWGGVESSTTTTSAHYDGQSLGQYVTTQQARAAVDKAFAAKVAP